VGLMERTARHPGRWLRILAFLTVCPLWTDIASSAPRQIDTARSSMTVRVYKAGVFGAMGHDHQIAAPIAGGTVDTAARAVEIHVDAAALRVNDATSSEKDRKEIQTTMLGPGVLDAEQHSKITFRSKAVEEAGPNSWKLQGDLTLHGVTHPVEVAVQETDGHYRGNSRFRQTEFGIKPVKIAGGAVRVKDELDIEFDIQLAR
jgi:polyisoprenoid-binding protein YceI